MRQQRTVRRSFWRGQRAVWPRVSCCGRGHGMAETERTSVACAHPRARVSMAVCLLHGSQRRATSWGGWRMADGGWRMAVRGSRFAVREQGNTRRRQWTRHEPGRSTLVRTVYRVCTRTAQHSTAQHSPAHTTPALPTPMRPRCGRTRVSIWIRRHTTLDGEGMPALWPAGLSAASSEQQQAPVKGDGNGNGQLIRGRLPQCASRPVRSAPTRNPGRLYHTTIQYKQGPRPPQRSQPPGLLVARHEQRQPHSRGAPAPRFRASPPSHCMPGIHP